MGNGYLDNDEGSGACTDVSGYDMVSILALMRPPPNLKGLDPIGGL